MVYINYYSCKYIYSDHFYNFRSKTQITICKNCQMHRHSILEYTCGDHLYLYYLRYAVRVNFQSVKFNAIFFNQMNLKKITLINSLVLLSGYCILLTFLRIYITHSIFYGFLLWNLFLAYIPFLITTKLYKINHQQFSSFRFWCLFLVWLSFLPNAPYIVTDLFHLPKGFAMPLWFDLLLICSYAINGCVLFFISVHHMHQILISKMNGTFTWILTISIFFLCGFGIYLGRYLRWNSWDVIQNPFSLLNDILLRISNPLQHPKTWGVTFGFGSLFFLGFLIFKSIIQNKSNESKVF